MIKLIKIKPIIFLLVTIGLIPILFFITWLLAYSIGPEGATFSALLLFGGLIGFYLLWINTICMSLNLINVKHGISSSIKKNNILLGILFSAYLLRMIISLPYLESIDSLIGMPLNILIGVIGIISYTLLFYKISDDYTFLTKSKNANLVDYFIMTFYFSFFLIGLLILHSQVRQLLKDSNIIDE